MNNDFEKIAWVILFSIRGLVYSFPFLSITALSAGGHLTWFTHPGMSFFVSLITLLSLWIKDYENGYLPNWLKRHITFS